MPDLAITTSTDVLSIAVTDGEAVGCETVFLARRHAEEITPALKRLSSGFEFALEEIKNIYVDIGPGRFTGLRVGIATAIGVALGSGATIKTLNSLQVLRHSLQDTHRHGPNKEGSVEVNAGARVLGLVDARRGEYFGQWFQGLEAQDEIQIFTPEDLELSLASQPSPFLVIGDGADLYLSNQSSKSTGSVGLAHITHLPGIRSNAEVMLKMDSLASIVDVNSLEPLYLREPDAVVGFKTKSDDFNSSNA